MRFNIGIDPRNLTDEQLYAESRELKFLPAYFKRYGMRAFDKQPGRFCLGKGHILFFVYKPTYSLNRYLMVLGECRRRGIAAEDESWRWDVYGGMTDSYHEEGWEAEVIRRRIIENIRVSPKSYFHYNHERVTKEQAIALLS